MKPPLKVAYKEPNRTDDRFTHIHRNKYSLVKFKKCQIQLQNFESIQEAKRLYTKRTQ